MCWATPWGPCACRPLLPRPLTHEAQLLIEQGLDSLSAVELDTWLQEEHGMSGGRGRQRQHL